MARFSMTIILALAIAAVAEVPEGGSFSGSSFIKVKDSIARASAKPRREDPSASPDALEALAKEMTDKSREAKTYSDEMKSLTSQAQSSEAEKRKTADLATVAEDAHLFAADSHMVAEDRASAAAVHTGDMNAAKTAAATSSADLEISINNENEAREESAIADNIEEETEVNFTYAEKAAGTAKVASEDADRKLQSCNKELLTKQNAQIEAQKKDDAAKEKVKAAEAKLAELRALHANIKDKLGEDRTDLNTAMSEQTRIQGDLEAAATKSSRSSANEKTAINARKAAQEALDSQTKIYDKVEVQAAKAEEEAITARETADQKGKEAADAAVLVSGSAAASGTPAPEA